MAIWSPIPIMPPAERLARLEQYAQKNLAASVIRGQSIAALKGDPAVVVGLPSTVDQWTDCFMALNKRFLADPDATLKTYKGPLNVTLYAGVEAALAYCNDETNRFSAAQSSPNRFDDSGMRSPSDVSNDVQLAGAAMERVMQAGIRLCAAHKTFHAGISRAMS